MQTIVPYWQTLGLDLKETEPGKAVFEANVRPDLLQNGVLHGGVLASIADSACAVAAISRIFPENYATTINLQVSYLKPVVAGRFRAVGRACGQGRRCCSARRRCSMRKRRWYAARHRSMVIPWQEGRRPNA